MGLYLDTSCLLKLVLPEPESERVLSLCASEERIVVSALARLEARVHINGLVAGGFLRRAAGRRLQDKLDATIALAPYEFAAVPPAAFQAAEAQLATGPRAAHCRTLDRLHLAIMEIAGLRRILTNDDAQARAAQAMGISVVTPR